MFYQVFFVASLNPELDQVFGSVQVNRERRSRASRTRIVETVVIAGRTSVDGLSGDNNERSLCVAALAAFVVGYNVTHHSGLFYGSKSALDGTRVADWLDLLTPIAVLAPLLVCLSQLRPVTKWWVVFACGALLYVQGHGIHLAANSVSNAIDSRNPATDVVHLWDEVVGHYVWYTGVYLALFAVVGALHHTELPVKPWLLVGAGAVSGLTWATNGLEGGTAVFSLVLALGAVAYGSVHRRGAALPVGAAGIVATLTLSIYGLWQAGFPQPSEL